jgi:uncharacterized protein (DUF488 family)
VSTLYTIGHSRHSQQRFLELLRKHGIEVLVDVRSQPYSKWAPHFKRELLSIWLPAAGVEYVFAGLELGGKVDYDERLGAQDFVESIDRLAGLARERVTAIMCAEENPERCHRRLLLTPPLIGQSVKVLHIRGDGELVSEEQLAAPGLQRSLFE